MPRQKQTPAPLSKHDIGDQNADGINEAKLGKQSKEAAQTLQMDVKKTKENLKMPRQKQTPAPLAKHDIGDQNADGINEAKLGKQSKVSAQTLQMDVKKAKGRTKKAKAVENVNGVDKSEHVIDENVRKGRKVIEKEIEDGPSTSKAIKNPKDTVKKSNAGRDAENHSTMTTVYTVKERVNIVGVYYKNDESLQTTSQLCVFNGKQAPSEEYILNLIQNFEKNGTVATTADDLVNMEVQQTKVNGKPEPSSSSIKRKADIEEAAPKTKPKSQTIEIVENSANGVPKRKRKAVIDDEPDNSVSAAKRKERTTGEIEKIKKADEKPGTSKQRGRKPKSVDETDEKIPNVTNGVVIQEVEKPGIAKPRGRKPKVTDENVDQTEASKDTEVKKEVVTNPTVTKYKKEDFGLTNKDHVNGDTLPFNLKISSWNVAGLRSWLKKDGLKFLDYENPDIFCIQETKCTTDQLPEEAARIAGYHPYWLCMPGGYAGVALYSKIMPINVHFGINQPEFDNVGRAITAEYEKFYVVNVYVPNSGRKLVNLDMRMIWEEKFKDFVNSLDKLKPVIICGDMNVSHKEIDLANPKSNMRNAGFTKEEREKMTELLNSGFVDTYRHFYPNKEGAYTFWTYMGNARARNVGWRLDYFIVSERIIKKAVDQCIRQQVLGSDHCPLTLFLQI